MTREIAELIIQEIQKKCGAISNEVIVPLDTRGNLKSYIEAFRVDHVIVGVYNDNLDIVDTYRLSYTDMSLKELKRVLDAYVLFKEEVLDLED
jgi:hypothetical protein